MKKKRYKKSRKPKFKLNLSLIWNLSLVAVAIAFIGALGYFVIKSDIFLVKSEDIKSNILLSRSTKNYFLNKSLFRIKSESISKKILESFPAYREVRIEKRFPSEINVFIVKRSTFAQIKSKLFYPIDRDLVVLGKGSKEPLKNVIAISLSGFDKRLKRGQRLDNSKLKQALEIIDALRSIKIFQNFMIDAINVVNVRSAHFLISKNNHSVSGTDSGHSIKVIVGQGNVYKKIKLLKGVIEEKLSDKLDLVKYIDLRHEKVYVGFRR